MSGAANVAGFHAAEVANSPCRYTPPRGGSMRNALVLACALALAHAAAAEQIVVSNYAVTTNGMPFAVAMEKGFFKEFKVDVDGILTSGGGGGLRGAGRRGPENHQRQRAHRGRVRLGGDAQIPGQLAQGSQGPQARL